MKKTIICTSILLCLACLLCGCVLQPLSVPADRSAAQTAPTAAEPLRTTELQTEPVTTKPAEAEPTAAEPIATEPTAAEPTAAEPAGTEVPISEPVQEPKPLYNLVDEVFTNGILEIRLEDGKVLCREPASGREELLFTPEQPAETTLELIGVSDERLYFGWNEEDDWWGLNVYSVNHRGEDRREYGGDWEAFFRDGWMILYGFRTDVSPTEMLVINSRDETLASELNEGSVWSGEVLNGSFYYIYIDIPYDEDPNRLELTDVPYQVIRIDPDGGKTVLVEFHLDSFYHPAFIGNDGEVNIYSENSTEELFSYDIFAGGEQ